MSAVGVLLGRVITE